jgi:sec-independent protein translocase protein TatB
MFDIGWTELLVLGAIALIVVGPKDLPGMLRKLGQFAGQAKRMARDFQRTMDEAADQADLKDLRDLQKSASDWSSPGGARRKAESYFGGGEEPAPEPGSHAAAEEAEHAAWSRKQSAPAAGGGDAASPKAATANAGTTAPSPEDKPAEDEPPASRSA